MIKNIRRFGVLSTRLSILCSPILAITAIYGQAVIDRLPMGLFAGATMVMIAEAWGIWEFRVVRTYYVDRKDQPVMQVLAILERMPVFFLDLLGFIFTSIFLGLGVFVFINSIVGGAIYEMMMMGITFMAIAVEVELVINIYLYGLTRGVEAKMVAGILLILAAFLIIILGVYLDNIIVIIPGIIINLFLPLYLTK